MSTKRSSFYAVKNGKDGPYLLYDSWSLCLEATMGVKGSKFKKVGTKESALEFLECKDEECIFKKTPTAAESPHDHKIVYADGGCTANGSDSACGGIGVWFGADSDQNVSLPLLGDTQSNNRSELMAAILAVLSFSPDQSGEVRTDSTYTIRSVSDRYPNPDSPRPANFDLIRVLKVAMEEHPGVKLAYVEAHTGIEGNEKADQLATAAIKKRKQDSNEEPKKNHSKTSH
jgi:ribonuclease HI